MAFADNLKQLPAVTHLAALQLLNTDTVGEVVAIIENVPDKTGSLTVYAYLAAKHGSINVAAAQEGLVMFAEHTEDARDHPGSHPNIDRLLDVLSTGKSLSTKLINA